MPQLKTYDLFISHSWTYTDGYDKLISFFNNAPTFKYRNYSVPKDDPIHNAPNETLLYQAIQRKIAPVNIVVIMAGVYSTYSKWINREIEIANYYSKPILGVAPWGNNRISTVVNNASYEIAGWNTNSIVSAIRRLAI
jgi:hypothetical protein